MYGINLHLSSKLMINVGKYTIQKEHHGIGIIILTTQGSLWTNQYDSWKFFMAPGEIVAPEAEEVPFSRMVNREMHRAGSCRPCLHLGKGRLWCVLVRERSWELLRWGDLYFFPKVNWGAIWNMQNLPNHRGSWPDFFLLGHLEGKFHPAVGGCSSFGPSTWTTPFPTKQVYLWMP